MHRPVGSMCIMCLMHSRVSRGRRRNIDSLGADAVACLLLVLLAAFVGVAPFWGLAPAIAAVAAFVGAEVALGIYGAGIVDERTVRGGWGSSTARAGPATTPWSGFFVGAGESRRAGELFVDGGCTNSEMGVGVEGSGAVVTILNVAVTEGDAGADSVVVAGRANCSTEASISGGLSECTSTASEITGSGRVDVELAIFDNDGL